MRVGSKYLPLNALQGFEAAARHLNMRRAGEELSLTQSAISHQVRSLEAALGKPLFDENRRRLSLTPDGRRLLVAVKQGLETIAAAATQVSEDAFSSSLKVLAPAALASQWLVPRLPRFLELYPDLTFSLEINSSAKPSDLAQIDAAIVFNNAHFPGMRVEELTRLEMFPVCAPGVLSSGVRMLPEDLQHETLIHEDEGQIWAHWFAATGSVQVEPRRKIFASGTQAALSLAIAGTGFAIDDGIMGETALSGLTLVRPFGTATFSFGHYSTVTPPLERVTPAALAFADWVRREMEQTSRLRTIP
ncbi:MAG: LysR substrate-binding domain-containing protein [Roseobacter sp.]|jgi:LysR family glycine cleavage system transcriptional activator|nr:LysR substrate-binding domain-containing protein [Roseobacter sp.]